MSNNLKIQPLVTIVTVTYNSSRFVETAINSVLRSNYTNLELIILDDNSKDNTWDIINKFDDNRIRAYKNVKNLGEYKNRQKAVDLAEGDFLLFIDGDDYLYPHGIEQFLVASQINEKAAMIIARPESDHMIYPVCLTPEQVFKYEFLGDGLLSQGFPSTLFKTEYLKSTSLETNYISGDLYIKYNLGFRYPVVLCPDGVVWWRRTPGQASEKILFSVTGLIQTYKIRIEFLDKYKDRLDLSTYREIIKKLHKPIVRRFLKGLLTLNFKEVKTIYSSLNIIKLKWGSLFYTNNSTYKIASSKNPLRNNHD